MGWDGMGLVDLVLWSCVERFGKWKRERRSSLLIRNVLSDLGL